MSSEIREYLKAAQDAELRGDKARAIDLLKKCATMYRNNGNVGRALQMLRHARRLDGTRNDIEEEVRRLEWLPDTSLARAVDAGEVDRDTDAALAPLAAMDPSSGPSDPERARPPKRLIERGPAKADPGLPAWCSFCCKPKSEVGEMIAGPAGAFICIGCLTESSALLGLALPRGEALAGGAPAPGAAAAERSSGRAPEEDEAGDDGLPFVGHAEALAVLDAALRSKAGLLLLLGPRGSGKTTCLQDLQRRGLGTYASSLEALATAPAEQRLLWDGELGPELLEHLRSSAPERQVIAAARSHLLDPAFTLEGEAGSLPIYSSLAIVEGTEGGVPLAIAERAQAVTVLRPLKLEELREIARNHARARGDEVELAEEVLAAVAEEALRSERGGYEVAALVQRIPPGTWSLAQLSAEPAPAPDAAAASPAPAKRRGKKKAEG